MSNEYETSIFQKLFNEEKTEELSDEMLDEIKENIVKDKKVKYGEVKRTKTSKAKNSISSLKKNDIDKITSTFDSLLKEVKAYSDFQRKEATSKIHKQLSDYIENPEYKPRSI